MTLAQLFWIAHIPAAVGWIALFALPLIGPAAIRIARVAAAVLALGYLALFIAAPDGLRGLIVDYSLAGIGALFTDPRAVLIGWVHYLAFDLWVGAWEAEDGRRTGLSHWLVAPCLFLTLMLGLLAFLGLRAWRGRAVAP